MEKNTANDRQWYYKKQSGRQEFMRGPFTRQEILKKHEDGVIDRDTFIRYGNGYWYPLSHYLSDVPIYKKPFVKFIVLFLIAASILLLVSRLYRARAPYKTPVTASGLPSVQGKGPLTEPKHPLQEALTKEDIIRLTNSTRVQNGLQQLAENQLLNDIAEERVRDMFEKQYFGHVSTTGEGVSDVAQRAGYRYKVIAENIASGRFLNNQKIIDGWLQSPGHRKNMLSRDIQEIGVAVAEGTMQGQNTFIAVQVFGLQSPPVTTQLQPRVCNPPSKELRNEIEVKKAEISNLNSVLADMKQQLDIEKESIEADKRTASNDKQAMQDRRIKIAVYNEKANVHNNLLAEVKAKRMVLEDMIKKYNEMVQNYHECQSSK